MNTFSGMRTTLVIALMGLTGTTLAQEPLTPTHVVDTLERKFGSHHGQRRNHTKGQCFGGYFEASDIAARFTRSPIMNGQRVTVIGRFSHAGGNPNASDAHSRVFGMALQLSSGNVRHQMAMLDIPFFAVSTPQGFLARLQAALPNPNTGKPSTSARKQFEQQHPESQRLKQWMQGQNRTPASYTRLDFHSIHTFILENDRQQRQPVRWSFIPEDGIQRLTSRSQPDVLANRLTTRLQQGPARFQMQVILPADADDLNDPARPWQGNGQPHHFGTLTLTTTEAECEAINFDPMVLSDGILPSDDPVLRFRSPAYAVSWARRRAEALQSQPKDH